MVNKDRRSRKFSSNVYRFVLYTSAASRSSREVELGPDFLFDLCSQAHTLDSVNTESAPLPPISSSRFKLHERPIQVRRGIVNCGSNKSKVGDRFQIGEEEVQEC